MAFTYFTFNHSFTVTKNATEIKQKHLHVNRKLR